MQVKVLPSTKVACYLEDSDPEVVVLPSKTGAFMVAFGAQTSQFCRCMRKSANRGVARCELLRGVRKGRHD